MPAVPVAEPLTPPVLLALVVGAAPLCGSELALLLDPDGEVLALAVVEVSAEVEPRLPLLLPETPVELEGDVALAEVDGEVELLEEPRLLDEPRLAEVVSVVP